MTTVPAPSVEGVYVLRVPAEREVQQYLASAPAQMLLVVGPKGSGKSTPVQHALAGRPGTVAIEFSDDMVATQMYRAIAKRVCPGKPALHERASKKKVLLDLLQRDFRAPYAVRQRALDSDHLRRSEPQGHARHAQVGAARLEGPRVRPEAVQGDRGDEQRVHRLCAAKRSWPEPGVVARRFDARRGGGVLRQAQGAHRHTLAAARRGARKHDMPRKLTPRAVLQNSPSCRQAPMWQTS
mmetsp:Transcript_34276/g.80879  ORF Transcript_34276/g.80879 Transcript_34276/m.80879 type:complete len:239 (+) Transcript_34276:260-976(+)